MITHTIKQIKKQIQNAKAIEDALLFMLADERMYEDDELVLITMKVFETCGYIVQLNNLLDIKIRNQEREKGDEDE